MFELDANGAVRSTPCWAALEHACGRIKPDAVILDPMVVVNGVPESDNQLMRQVMTLLRIGMAQRFNCALVLAHHDNKHGSDDAGDGDAANARGAGDIVNAVRFELAVKKMSAAQAGDMGVDRDRRGFYFRCGSAASKLNYSAPEESEWFQRLPIPINGEQVVRCIPWQPPAARLDDAMAAALIEAIGKGTKHGPYSPQIGNSDRSLGPLLEDLGIGGKAQQRALRDLQERHGVVKAKWLVPGQRHERQGLRTAAGLPDNFSWLDGEEAEG